MVCFSDNFYSKLADTLLKCTWRTGVHNQSRGPRSKPSRNVRLHS